MHTDAIQTSFTHCSAMGHLGAVAGLLPLLVALLPHTPLLVLTYISLDTPSLENMAHGLLV